MSKVTSLAWCKTCDTGQHLNYLMNQSGKWKIVCTNCGLTLTDWYETKELARKAWNKFLYNIETTKIKPVLECVHNASKSMHKCVLDSIAENIHREYSDFISEIFKDGDINILYEGSENKIKTEASLHIKVLFEVIEIEGDVVNFSTKNQGTLFGIDKIFKIIYSRLSRNRLAMILFQEIDPDEYNDSLYKKWLITVSLPKKLGAKGEIGPNDKALANIHIGHPDPVGPKGIKGDLNIKSPFGNIRNKSKKEK